MIELVGWLVGSLLCNVLDHRSIDRFVRLLHLLVTTTTTIKQQQQQIQVVVVVIGFPLCCAYLFIYARTCLLARARALTRSLARL